jgi:hypothetical protein
MYHSIGQLAADSRAVIVLTATATASGESVQGIPYTVTQARVERVIRGELQGSTVRIRQLGGTGVTVEGGSPILKSGRTYLAFIEPFTFGPGAETDQWVIVGAGAGLFLVQGTTLTRLDPESVDLPVATSFDSLQASLPQ